MGGRYWFKYARAIVRAAPLLFTSSLPAYETGVREESSQALSPDSDGRAEQGELVPAITLSKLMGHMICLACNKWVLNNFT